MSGYTSSNYNKYMKLKATTILTLGVIAFALPSFASAAMMSVSPASQTVKAGDSFTVSVKLDTQGAAIDGVDIRYLTFNPSLLQVEDANTSTPGVQISPQSLMAMTVLNSVDNTAGKIAFSQVAAGGTKYSGSGTLATIRFKAMAQGTASLVFGYTPKSTTDSNVASGGSDILNAVVNGSYSITKGTGQPVAPVLTVMPIAPQQIGNPIPEQITSTQLPDSDNSAFQFSEKKSFWQIVKEMIVNYVTGFHDRFMSIFKK
jgi:hypothetical protein